MTHFTPIASRMGGALLGIAASLIAQLRLDEPTNLLVLGKRECAPIGLS